MIYTRINLKRTGLKERFSWEQDRRGLINRGSESIQRLLDRIWGSQWLSIAAAASIPAIIGLLTALAMPRGPVTAPQVLVVMITGFIAGFFAGLFLCSRWAMLLGPVVYFITFEFGRVNARGPTVDAIGTSSSFDLLAFVAGRGVHGMLSLVPMVLGVAYGAGLARRIVAIPPPPAGFRQRLWLATRRVVASLTTLALIALAFWALQPARTPAITGVDGEPVPGSIATLEKVTLGGHDQWIMIRGVSASNPVLLYLSGGPGQSDLAFSRVLFEDLTRDFVVVGWDQRGTGKSYPSLEPTSTLTPEQAIADTIELVNLLRERFDQEKIYLLGESWGTLLGVLAVQQQPDLFHAYIGSGQMVSPLETDRRIRADLLAYAELPGNNTIIETMRDYGEPPYDDIFAYAYVMTHYDDLAGAYDPPEAYEERGTSAGIGPYGVFGSEYTLIEKVNVLRGLMDVFAIMYPQIQGVDFRRDVPELDVPVYILDAEHELDARRKLAIEWFDQLEAPVKRIFTFENAGHSVAFEQFEELHRILVEVILPQSNQAP